MKGLLLKDFYMLIAYCKYYLVVALVFGFALLPAGGGLFFLFYPCFLCGTLPITLMGYDERSHWIVYAQALPYTKRQIVSSKYIVGLLAQAGMLLTVGVIYGIRLMQEGSFVGVDFWESVIACAVAGMLTPALSMPLMFRWGVEKGRFTYAIIAGAIACAVVAGGLVSSGESQIDLSWLSLPLICVGGLALYLLSWHLSVVFYQGREVT